LSIAQFYVVRGYPVERILNATWNELYFFESAMERYYKENGYEER
jgi:hypothetical protein